jgi:Zinc carboxypeptidase
MRTLRFAAGAVLPACLLIGVPAIAEGATVSASKSVARACHKGVSQSRSGRDLTRVRAPARGIVRVKLKGRGGDWDLGVFGKGGRRVAGGAGYASNEFAEGFVRKGERLVVQACRFRGTTRRARLSVRFIRVRKSKSKGKVQIVDVRTRNRAAKRRLQGLGLDLTEHGDRNSIEVVLHGRRDARKLRRAGFRYRVRIKDLVARERRNRRRDSRFAARAAASDLPSGRDSYRRLPDYDFEMKRLAMRYPGLVKPITLNHKTVLGRDVNGIEITTNPNNTQDGKPVFVNMGVHHAREWPSSEHAIEFAYDLLRNYGRSQRVKRLVQRTRTIVVPIVNVDGFNISREAAPLGDFSQFDYEMKRKNCSLSRFTPPQYQGGTCENNPAGRLRGTDPNRNYGGLWGGNGASPTWSSDTYRGDGPFSEPEIQNIHELVQTRQVTNLITNHTFSNLVLRVPGVADMGFPHEEPAYKALGKRMTDHNRYRNIPGFMLYDTTGSTEDWSFWTAGGWGFTFEIGPTEFHPPYQTGVVAEYLGREPAAGAGRGGNQAAYYEMLEATADEGMHSVLTGEAPKGWTLKIHKRFLTSTSPVHDEPNDTTPGPAIKFEDFLQSTFLTPGGRFAWHVNPSTRPIVAGRYGREPTGPKQADQTFANPAGVPAPNEAYPDPPYDTTVPFTVQGPEDGVDNGKMAVRIEFGNPATDWDLYVVNADTGELATSSAGFGDTDEEAILFDPEPGNYVAHVVNFSGGAADDWFNGTVKFSSPTPAKYGPTESWQLSCIRPNGQTEATRDVTVLRGQRVDVGKACKAKK